MRKLLSCLLLLLMLLPLIAGCQDSSKQPVQTTEQVTLAPGETEAPYVHHVAKTDYNELEFVIAAPETWGNTLFDREEMTDETVNDAIYTRNRQVEDYFNISISSFNLGYTHEQAAQFKTFSMSGEDIVALIGVAFTQSAKPMITEGIALPWNDVPHIDLDRVYWNKDVTKTMAVLGNYYYLSGDINWPTMQGMSCWFFNKEVAERYSIPDLYQTVRDGKWTWDTAGNYIKKVTTENGDGKWDENDTYGHLQYTHAAEAWVYGANYQTAVFTPDGPIMNFYTQKMMDIVNHVYDLIHTTHNSIVIEDQNLIGTIFFDNRALFLTDVLGVGESFRQQEGDFGILPNPKYDEKQKEYKTVSDQWGLVLCLPSTSTNIDRTAAITEVLGAKSLEYVRPAYYEKTLMGKVKRDDESEEMITILFANVLYDSGQCYLSKLEWLPIRATAIAGNKNLASWWKKNEKQITANFTELYDAVKAQNELT